MIPRSYRDEPLTGWDVVKAGWWYGWRGLLLALAVYGWAILFLSGCATAPVAGETPADQVQKP